MPKPKGRLLESLRAMLAKQTTEAAPQLAARYIEEQVRQKRRSHVQ